MKSSITCLWAAVCVTLLAAGCGGGGESAPSPALTPVPAPPNPPAPPTPPTPPTPPVTGDGCGVVSPVGQVSDLHVLDGQGVSRSFELHVSPAYDRNKPAAVVFDFHGAGGSIAGTRGDGFQDAIKNAGDQGIVVIPQGIPWQGYGVGWDESCSGYDMAFFDNMLKHVAANYCVDKGRVFVAGFSWGADMTHALACCRGNQIKGIAPFSGSEMNNRSCSTTQYPAVRFRYGGSDGAYSQSSFQAATTFYRNAHACSAASDPVSPSPCVAYRSCGAPVLECKFPSMGHQSISPAEAADTWQFWKSLR